MSKKIEEEINYKQLYEAAESNARSRNAAGVPATEIREHIGKLMDALGVNEIRLSSGLRTINEIKHLTTQETKIKNSSMRSACSTGGFKLGKSPDGHTTIVRVATEE